jgi:diguanylate cyclase (GGDEF)-like protein
VGSIGVITEMNVPLELAILLCAAFCAVGAWAGKMRAVRQRRHPLTDLMQPATLEPVIDLAARRNAMREASRTVLHGRIDQLAALRASAGSAATREQFCNHVASVMRAGLRRGDRLTHIDGEGFTIILPGADERSGTRIADRFRSSLTQVRFSHHHENAVITASFGVAAGRYDERSELLNRRARHALETSKFQERDDIVSDSEIVELMYLPASDASPAQTMAAASAA